MVSHKLLIRNLVSCLAVVGILGGLAGCGQVDSFSTVASDGAFEKSVTVTISNDTQMPGMEEEPQPLNEMLIGVGEWAGKDESTPEERVYTISKSFGAGDTATYGLHGDGTGEFVRSEAKSRVDGEFVIHEETWTWVGKPKDGEVDEAREEVGALIAKHMEGFKVSDEAMEGVVMGVIKGMHREMFGPGDPLISKIFNPQSLERELQLSIYRVVEDVLVEKSIGGMSAEKAKEIARAVALDYQPEAMGVNDAPQPGAESEDDDNATLISMLIKMTGEGEIVDTNGEVNPVTGEVEWLMYSDAPGMEPVKLWVKFKK